MAFVQIGVVVRNCASVFVFPYENIFVTFRKIQVAITKTHLFKYIENFTTKKGKKSDKNSDIFHISSQNIDCGYPLEPPPRGGSNEYPQPMFLA